MDVDAQPERPAAQSVWLPRVEAVLWEEGCSCSFCIGCGGGGEVAAMAERRVKWLVASEYDGEVLAELVEALVHGFAALSRPAQIMVHSTVSVCFLVFISQIMPRFASPYHMAGSNIADVVSVAHRILNDDHHHRDADCWVRFFILHS